MSCPYATLALHPNSTPTQVLQAYTRLILAIDPTDEYLLVNTRVHELTTAKNACLDQIAQANIE